MARSRWQCRGQVAGLGLAHERFGTWSWSDLVAPSCVLAERGMAVDWHATVAIAASAPELAHDSGCAATYMADGFPLAAPWIGDALRIRLGRLAETLRWLAEAGPQDFYSGEIAQAIGADMAALGGRLSAADLANYEATIEAAPETGYRDARVMTAPGLTAGPTLVDVLNRLETSLAPGEAPDGEAYVAYAEALEAAYAERLRGMGAGSDADRVSCTSHLGAADRDGTVVALTQTLLSPFGAKVMLPETGILMNNGIMWFDPRPGGPNSIAPDKRPLSNMCPAIVEFADGRRAALGASGGPPHPARRRAAALLPRGFRHEAGRRRALPAHQRRRQRPSRGGCQAAGRDSGHAGGPAPVRGASARGASVRLRLPQCGRLGAGERHRDRRRPRHVPQRQRRRTMTPERRESMSNQTRLGMITPSLNTVLEPVTYALLADLPDVTAHFSRVRVSQISLGEDSAAQFGDEPMLAAARMLADARVHAICWNGTAGSWLGPDFDRRLCEAIARETGIPATSATLALAELFRSRGVKRFALVTPFEDALQEAIVDTYRREGLRVCGRSVTSIAMIPSATRPSLRRRPRA